MGAIVLIQLETEIFKPKTNQNTTMQDIYIYIYIYSSDIINIFYIIHLLILIFISTMRGKDDNKFKEKKSDTCSKKKYHSIY